MDETKVGGRGKLLFKSDAFKIILQQVLTSNYNNDKCLLQLNKKKKIKLLHTLKIQQRQI